MTILELATDLELPNNGVFWHEIRNRIIDEKYIKCEFFFARSQLGVLNWGAVCFRPVFGSSSRDRLDDRPDP